jgi:chemotaxis protein methyltransferase CheR
VAAARPAARPATDPTLGAQGTAAQEREFPFEERDFERVRALIYRRAGIRLSEQKRDMVYSRLARRLRATGHPSFAAYLDRLEDGGCDEWQGFINALTTNLTAFFREAHHFPVLADLLTDLVADRATGHSDLTLWSAAASTGEEPYSMAITALRTLGLDAPVRILATDVDTDVLSRARRGVYPLEAVERLPRETLARFFLRGTGSNAGLVRVRPEVRRLVTFRPFNLLTERWPMRGPFAAIFCRNVMIYFDKKTQLTMLEKMVRVMDPRGLFFAGHAESLQHAGHRLRALGKTVYRPITGA